MKLRKDSDKEITTLLGIQSNNISSKSKVLNVTCVVLHEQQDILPNIWQRDPTYNMWTGKKDIIGLVKINLLRQFRRMQRMDENRIQH